MCVTQRRLKEIKKILLGLVVTLVFFSVAVASAQEFAFDLAWGSEGSGKSQFLIPMNLAVDSTGNVYVEDHRNNRIQKFRALATIAPGPSEMRAPVMTTTTTMIMRREIIIPTTTTTTIRSKYTPTTILIKPYRKF